MVQEGSWHGTPSTGACCRDEEIIEEEALVENGPQELDDLDDLGDLDEDQMKATLMWMSCFPKMGLVIEIESSSLSL
jgi:hypothetical protein